jgi:NADPH:quinone reductase-like Zn-dependent oxidoreductase
MRAIEVHPPFGIGHLRIVERPQPPAPGPGQVLVRIRAAALNYRDLLVVSGFERWRPPAGRIPCSDAAGEIVATGPDVARVRAGERVLSTILPRWIDGPLAAPKLAGSLGGAGADGVLAEYVLLSADSVVRAPDYLSDVEAATLPCAALTAWHALTRAESLRPGASLLVQGTGGVSLFALQFASASGTRVIVTSSSDEKLVRASELGAAATINYQSRPQWDHEVQRLTDGAGVDHVIDVGGAATLARAIAAARYEGTVSIVGLIGGLRADLDLSSIFIKNLRLHGVETGSRRMLEEMIDWMAQRCLRPVISECVPMEDVRSAFRRMEGAQHFGKICIAL